MTTMRNAFPPLASQVTSLTFRHEFMQLQWKFPGDKKSHWTDVRYLTTLESLLIDAHEVTTSLLHADRILMPSLSLGSNFLIIKDC